MANQKALVAEDSKALESWEDAAGDWESDGTEDITPGLPVLKMVHGVSRMEGAGRHSGEFWHSDTEEFESHPQVVMLITKDTRAYFEKGMEEPSCVSADGVAPLPDQPYWAGADTGPQPANCADCPLSVWPSRKEPSPCKLSQLVLVDRGEGRGLAQMRIGGTSLSSFRAFIKMLKKKERPMFSVIVNLSTEERSGNGNKWNQLVIDLERPLTRDEARPYNEMVREQRESFQRSLDEVPANNGAFDDDAIPFDD